MIFYCNGSREMSPSCAIRPGGRCVAAALVLALGLLASPGRAQSERISIQSTPPLFVDAQPGGPLEVERVRPDGTLEPSKRIHTVAEEKEKLNRRPKHANLKRALRKGHMTKQPAEWYLSVPARGPATSSRPPTAAPHLPPAWPSKWKVPRWPLPRTSRSLQTTVWSTCSGDGPAPKPKQRRVWSR